MTAEAYIPDYTEEVWLFNKKFDSKMGIEESTGKFCIGDYIFPNTLPQNVTKEFFLDLIQKSLADNHDYLLDFSKEHGKKIVYKEGCLY